MSSGRRITPPPAVPDTIVLTLNELEARTLKQICMSTGGDPSGSARKHMDAINSALIEAKVRSADHPTCSFDIFFDDEEASTL